MDMIEILGSLLGQKAGGSGAGADILKDILGGGSRGASPTQSAPRSAPAPSSRGSAVDDVDLQARELEDLLNVATGRKTQRQQSPTRQPSPQSPQLQPKQPQAMPRPAEAPRQGNPWQDATAGQHQDAPQDDAAARQNEQATIMVRAMVNAAKCDGQISPAEQQQILGQLDNPSPAAIQFLREEFARPFDVREFAWSVPVGMEQQVYSMSLIAIDVDSDREQSYLRDLAHGLRLPPEVCDQIKDRLTGARYAAAP